MNAPFFSPCMECQTLDVCMKGAGCAIAVRAAVEARNKLAAFGAAVLKLNRSDCGCDIDGGTLQDMAEKHGVIEQRTVTEPCGESCVCSEVGAIPGRCFFVPDDIRQLLPKD